VLAEEDISFIKMHLTEWLAEQSRGRHAPVYDIDLYERMEEALKNQGKELQAQREILQQFMQQVDKRFEQMQTNMDKRFEQQHQDIMGASGNQVADALESCHLIGNRRLNPCCLEINNMR